MLLIKDGAFFLVFLDELLIPLNDWVNNTFVAFLLLVAFILTLRKIDRCGCLTCQRCHLLSGFLLSDK